MRGITLGAFSGGALCLLARHRSGAASAAPMFGLGTAGVAAGRLWLTHGEVTGLTALMIGAALAVLCLGVAPALLDPDAEGDAGGAAVGLLYLAGAVLIGFGRVSARNPEFWADVPLLLDVAGVLASARTGRARLPSPFVPRRPSLWSCCHSWSCYRCRGSRPRSLSEKAGTLAARCAGATLTGPTP